MTTQFWFNEPTILFNKDYMTQLWPTIKMSYEEKLNAISRLIIILSFLGFIFTSSIKYILIGIVTLIVIYILFKTHKHKNANVEDVEGFSINNLQNTETQINNPATLDMYLKSDFETTNKKNPMGNVLLTQIHDTPNRKSAPPSFNTQVYEDINTSTKKMIQSLNPGIKNTNKQLFGDLGEKFEFDQSMWQYYSTPNTKVCNDQGAFADFLYGDMPSCRGGDSVECVKDNFRYNLY